MLYVDMCSVCAVGMYLACMCGLWNMLHIHMYYMCVLCMCAVYIALYVNVRCVICVLCTCVLCVCVVYVCVYTLYTVLYHAYAMCVGHLCIYNLCSMCSMDPFEVCMCSLVWSV